MVPSFAVVFLSLIARLCAAELILKSAEPNADFEIDIAAINVITSCYGNRGDAVGVGGNISGFLVKALSSHQIPVALVDDSTRIAVKFNIYRRTFRYNLQVFVISISSDKELLESMKETRRSAWWNHMASFLILYRSSRGCRDAELLLFLAWYEDMVNAKLICFDRRLGARIFGYNPYTTQAPEPWKIRGTYKTDIKNNYFTVFERSYREGKKICKNLDMDKIKNLNGYPVEEIHDYNDKIAHMGEKNNLNNFAKMYDNIIEKIFRVMNGNVVRLIYRYSDGGSRTVPFHDMQVGISPLVKGLEIPISRPFIETSMIAMTQHRGYMSQLQKILSVVDTHSNIGVCIVLVATLVFFKFFVRQATMPAILNVVRLLCNTGFANLPENTPPRLYLTSLLLFMVTMHGIYQGKLASLLTTQVPLPNVKTLEDLANFGHIIYVYNSSNIIFRDPIFEGRVIPLSSSDCSEYVLRNSSAACVDGAYILMDQAEELKLHLSDWLDPTLGVFMFRPDWPLEARFNIILGKMFEADVVVPFPLRMNRTRPSDCNFDEEVRNNQDFRNMTFRDLRFAFVILGIGLLCASITFIFEIVINRVRSRIRIKRVHVRPLR